MPALMQADEVDSAEVWTRIHDRECPLHLDQREPHLSAETVATMQAMPPFTRRYEGPLAGLASDVADLPADLAKDIAELANRFACVMAVNAVRVRLERVDSNACKKIHTDYTDVRLITTYAGPGTDIAPHGAEDCCLERVPTGWIGLFKGRTYAPDHPPCFHRSPPVGDTGEKRLVLVIDTPLNMDAAEACRYP